MRVYVYPLITLPYQLPRWVYSPNAFGIETKGGLLLSLLTEKGFKASR
jgi:hypothetical protein